MSDARGSGPRVLVDYLLLSEEFLKSKGVESPRLDAELLLAEVLGLSRIELYTSHDRPLGGPEVDRYRELVRRRAAREPVHYILGHREFWSLEFAVDRRVLIPRPESEMLVELASNLLAGREAADGDGSGAPQSQAAAVAAGSDAKQWRAADVGTGSGALAVALAVEVAGLGVVASDRSAAAIELAPANAGKHGVAERVEFIQGDLFEPYGERGPFDVILSNPPYVKREEFAGLSPEVRDWEPTGALVAADGGMDVTRRLVAQAPRWLTEDGWLLVEVGTQAAEVRNLFETSGWRELSSHTDLAGHDRVVCGRRPTDC